MNPPAIFDTVEFNKFLESMRRELKRPFRYIPISYFKIPEVYKAKILEVLQQEYPGLDFKLHKNGIVLTGSFKDFQEYAEKEFLEQTAVIRFIPNNMIDAIHKELVDVFYTSKFEIITDEGERVIAVNGYKP